MNISQLEKAPNELICLLDGDILLYRICYGSINEDDFYVVLTNLYNNLVTILANTNTVYYIGCLQGKGNFRNELAFTKSYKGNRKKEKPRWFYELREYMIDKLGFVEINGMEVDDALSIMQRKMPSTIICSIDKDLLQIPGLHYSLTSEQITEIDKDNSETNLWLQVLTGDTADNIGGIPGIGPKKANKILENKNNYLFETLSEYVNKFGEYEGIKRWTESYLLVKLLEYSEEFEIPEVRELNYLKPIVSYIGLPKIK